MDELLHNIWEKSLKLIEEEVSALSFSTFILSVKPLNISSNVITFTVCDDFIKDKVENKYYSLIRNAINQVTKKDYTLHFNLETDESTYLNEKEDTHTENNNTHLMSKYTFDTFVVGKSNRMAHAAAVAIAESPNINTYNPFFLYGGSGLGKTHLMHAIGNHIIKNNPSASVLYVTSEEFINEFIAAIGKNDFISFRNKYRNVDLLLIDDIQFFGDKQQTKEEFFHTFNALHQSNKQIIIASDRPPHELTFFEERITTRFQWGLIADIQKPDYETKIAILNRKAEAENVTVPNAIFEYIATNTGESIRELEGALNRVIVYSKMTNLPITIETAHEALRNMQAKSPKSLTIKLVLDTVSRYYDVRVEDLKSSKRSRDITKPRQVAMFLCRELLDTSFPVIGNEIGGKDHSTVMHAYDKIKSDISNDNALASEIEDIKKNITG